MIIDRRIKVDWGPLWGPIVRKRRQRKDGFFCVMIRRCAFDVWDGWRTTPLQFPWVGPWDVRLALDWTTCFPRVRLEVGRVLPWFFKPFVRTRRACSWQPYFRIRGFSWCFRVRWPFCGSPRTWFWNRCVIVWSTRVTFPKLKSGLFSFPLINPKLPWRCLSRAAGNLSSLSVSHFPSTSLRSIQSFTLCKRKIVHVMALNC